MIDPAYCMTKVLIALKKCFKANLDNLSLVSRSFIKGTCVVPLALAVMAISGSLFHPWTMILLISGWYCEIIIWTSWWIILVGESFDIKDVRLESIAYY